VGAAAAGAFFAAFGLGAFAAVFFAVAFFPAGAVFFAVADVPAFFAAAWRFFRAATILARPSALNFRFGFFVSAAGADGSDSPRVLDHLARCANAIFLRAAALNFRFGGAVSDVAVVDSAELPDSIARSSAICVSIRVFCDSKPSMAALMISGVSLGVDMSASR
jgi:hypothetical protein